MKVRELIEELAKYPSDHEVEVRNECPSCRGDVPDGFNLNDDYFLEVLSEPRKVVVVDDSAEIQSKISVTEILATMRRLMGLDK